MIHLLTRYTHWLHGRWPAGVPEPLPQVNDDGSTAIPGVFIVGDLTGIPLLKFALDSGARTAKRCLAEINKASVDKKNDEVFDIIIIGGGVAGMAAACECAKAKAHFTVIEGTSQLSTIRNFPSKKPIFTYPMDMTPSGDLQVHATVKEALLTELEQQLAQFTIPVHQGTASHITKNGDAFSVEMKEGKPLKAKRIIVAIGRSGNYRRLQVPGEELAIVTNRLHDPQYYAGKQLMVVGGGDSALEAAIACSQAGARVTLSYRGNDLARAKPDNVTAIQTLAQQNKLVLRLETTVTAIKDSSLTLKCKDGTEQLPIDAVLVLIGREPPLDFFRRSRLPIRGERSAGKITALIAFLIAMTLIYAWKGWIIPPLTGTLFPGKLLAGLVEKVGDPTSLLGVILNSAGQPGFWVTLAYSSVVVVFGIDRIRRRKTPYVRLQTLTLMTIQCLPLFMLPEIILPWLAANDLLPLAIRENLFPDDQWWKAYGFILAWPLMAWNVFTHEPNFWWLIISAIQTFVIIPLLVWRWGKGAYCGWICSCGALAETLGDRHRDKMPHGKGWNQVNMVGQVILATAFIILLLHIVSWIAPSVVNPDFIEVVLMKGYWKYAVDFLLAGALGVGFYFWLSGRVWCRFACPLAALMHIYARFSRFRIVVEQKKCISCNACTTVCHQGIDVMNFANKGQHMEDPECVRCSACVQTCPTGVLQFGEVDGLGNVVRVDSLAASPVLMREKQLSQ
jgi:thioredoxin reductase/ferredoxin